MAGDRYSITDQTEMHFITFTVVDWIDVFIRLSYKNVITESLNFCIENKGLEVFGWCLMTSHLHLLVRAKDGFVLSHIIRDFKKHTAKTIIDKIKNEPESRREWLLHKFEWAGKFDARITQYKFWQESNHAIIIYNHNPAMMLQKLNYIHQNPMQEGIVETAEEYLFSSARDYAGKKGLVKITLI
jgi:REP element-mobilizing transposase RayT